MPLQLTLEELAMVQHALKRQKRALNELPPKTCAHYEEQLQTATAAQHQLQHELPRQGETVAPRAEEAFRDDPVQAGRFW